MKEIMTHFSVPEWLEFGEIFFYALRLNLIRQNIQRAQRQETLIPVKLNHVNEDKLTCRSCVRSYITP